MITVRESDDPRFIALVSQMLTGVLATCRPAELYLVCIDTWFDAKWLGFSGKTLGAIGVWNRPVTLPPFHPHRVVAELHLSSLGRTRGFIESHADKLHIHQASAQNLRRSIADVSQSAVFLWYSSSTRDQDRGSVMTYHTHHGDCVCWYAGLRRAGHWILDRPCGISPSGFEHLLAASNKPLE